MQRTIRGLEPIGRVKRWDAHPGEDSYKGLGKEAGFEVDSEGRTVGGYVVSPAEVSGRFLVIIVPDIFGWRLPQTRRFADRLASALKSHTVMPDLLRGSSMDPFVFSDLAKEYASWSASNPIPRAISDLTAVAEGIGGAKNLEGVILIGLGWGATAVVTAAAETPQPFPIHALATLGLGELSSDTILAAAAAAAETRALILFSPEEEEGIKGLGASLSAEGCPPFFVQRLASDALGRVHATMHSEGVEEEQLATIVRQISEFVA